MTQTTNWYFIAKQSADESLKNLLKDYEALDAADPKKEEIKNQIKELVKEPEEKIIDTELDHVKEEKSNEEVWEELVTEGLSVGLGYPELGESVESYRTKINTAKATKMEMKVEKTSDEPTVNSEDEENEKWALLEERAKAIDPEYILDKEQGYELCLAEVEALEDIKPQEENDAPVAEAVSFEYTSEDVENAKDNDLLNKIADASRAEVKRLEKTRLANETYKERMALNRDIWNARRVGMLARAKMHDKKASIKKAEKKKSVSQIATKRARFIRLYKLGYSITNITTHSDGVKKSDIKDVVNEDVIKTCTEFDRNFVRTWNRWVEAKLGVKSED